MHLFIQFSFGQPNQQLQNTTLTINSQSTRQ